MAQTNFGTNDAPTVKLWGTGVIREGLKKTLFNKFMGKAGDSIIQRLTDLEKSAGDQIKYDLLMQLTGAGVTGNNRLIDNEEALSYYQDTVTVNQLRNGVDFDRMSAQRSVHDLRKDGQAALADWMSDKFDDYMFRCLCGDTTLTHGQTATAPTGDTTTTSNSEYVMSGDVSVTGAIATDEASLGTNDQFTLADIDYCVEKAKTRSPLIRPTTIDGTEHYVCVLHPYSVIDLRLDVGASAYTTWPEIQQNAAKRGKDNPIFSGALGMYNNVILFESNRIYTPRSNVRRNLFLGAQAGVFALAGAYDQSDRKKYGDALVSWFEETYDFGNQKKIAAGCIFGINKSVFNSKDYATLVIASYAAAHA